MPLGFQKRYYREDAGRNPTWLYVFGDNVARDGFGGQAKEMRGEPNAVGVCTKYFPGKEPGDYFDEHPVRVVAQNRIIDEDMKPLFAHLKTGGVVIWPTDGIGTERAALPTKAPSTFEHIQKKLAALVRVGKLFEAGRFEEALREAEQHG